MSDLAIVGIGNPYRGDDGAGWAAIDELEKKIEGKIPLFKVRGEITELMDLMANYWTLYVVDACRMEGPIGSWKRIDGHLEPLPQEDPQTSTHGLSLKEAIELAKTLGQLPSKLIIYAVNADQYSMSHALSPPVAEAIEGLAQNILKEEDIQACMKKA